MFANARVGIALRAGSCALASCCGSITSRPVTLGGRVYPSTRACGAVSISLTAFTFFQRLQLVQVNQLLCGFANDAPHGSDKTRATASHTLSYTTTACH